LKTVPVGPGCVVTTSGVCAGPLFVVYSVLVDVPLLETHSGVVGPKEMPHGFTRCGSVTGATPGWSEMIGVATYEPPSTCEWLGEALASPEDVKTNAAPEMTKPVPSHTLRVSITHPSAIEWTYSTLLSSSLVRHPPIAGFINEDRTGPRRGVRIVGVWDANVPASHSIVRGIGYCPAGSGRSSVDCPASSREAQSSGFGPIGPWIVRPGHLIATLVLAIASRRADAGCVADRMLAGRTPAESACSECAQLLCDL
jgi:hypothetical protein